MPSERSPFLADPALFAALEELSTPVRVGEDGILFRQGEASFGVFLVKTGEAVLEMHSEEGELIFRFQTQGGSLLGLPAVLGGQPYSLTAKAFRSAVVLFVNRADTVEFFATVPEMSFKALQLIAAQTRAARAQIASFLASRKHRGEPDGN